MAVAGGIAASAAIPGFRQKRFPKKRLAFASVATPRVTIVELVPCLVIFALARNIRELPLKPIYQPFRSRLCGQAVIATILGCTIEEAIRLVGHRHGTKNAELRAALASRAIHLGPVRLTAHHDLPERAVLRLSRPYGKNWHWCLRWDGETYDPAGMGIHIDRLKEGWSITSFMEITK